MGRQLLYLASIIGLIFFICSLIGVDGYLLIAALRDSTHGAVYSQLNVIFNANSSIIGCNG